MLPPSCDTAVTKWGQDFGTVCSRSLDVGGAGQNTSQQTIGRYGLFVPNADSMYQFRLSTHLGIFRSASRGRVSRATKGVDDGPAGRIHRRATRGGLVHVGGHLEVERRDDMTRVPRPQAHRYAVPRVAPVGMMVVLLRLDGHRLHEVEGPLEVGELEHLIQLAALD